MKSVFLEQMGIFGWDKLEPIILAALLADKAVMWEGLHGTAKTQISEAIAYSFLGGRKDRKFRYFNCPIATQDELLGYPDLAAMKNGEVKYIPTPTSVWGGNAVLMDEINRASMGMQGKFMELALSGTVMGQSTDIIMRFAAVNPPDMYLTTPMDMALLSRFAVVKAPSFKEIYLEDKSAVQKIAKAKIKPVNLLSDWKAMNAITLTPETEDLIDIIVQDFVEELFTRHDSVNFSGRQVNDLRRMLVGFYKYYKYTDLDLQERELHDIHAELALSCIPEATKLVNARLCVDRLTLQSSFIAKSTSALARVEAMKVETAVLHCLKDGKPSPKQIEEIIENVTPDKWLAVRHNFQKTVAWEKINKAMSYINISDELRLDAMLDIKKQVSLF